MESISVVNTCGFALLHHQLPCTLSQLRLPSPPSRRRQTPHSPQCALHHRRIASVPATTADSITNSVSPINGMYTVGDFMTRKKDLHVVKPTTTVEEAWEVLVGKKITGFPVINDDWELAFNEIQKLFGKTNGKVIGDLMTHAPLVVHESTNLGDAARLLLENKYRRLPVVDADGKLVGIITRGNIVRAALQIKRASENSQRF